MPPMEEQGRHQDALLFPMVGFDNYGEYTVDSDYVEIKVRWNPTERNIKDAKGNLVAIVADVIVDRDIDIGSLLWLGSRDDVGGTAEPPIPETGLMQVITFTKVPDIKGRNYHRTVSLARTTDASPTFA